MTIELLRLYLAKPLNAMIIALCVGSFYLHFGQVALREEVAVIKEQQKLDAKVNDIVIGMLSTIARIDANLEHVKEVQAKSVKPDAT